jgi:hypothetical protein
VSTITNYANLGFCQFDSRRWLWTYPGVVVPGCPACRKRLFTMANFMDHLADDVLPGLISKLSSEKMS